MWTKPNQTRRFLDIARRRWKTGLLIFQTIFISIFISIFGPIEGHKWFFQIYSQWESQKNRFFSFGKIQFLPSCIWDLQFMSYRLERSQMQGGKSWILPKEVNANRFFWDSHWLEIWKNNLYPSMRQNGWSVPQCFSVPNNRFHDIQTKPTAWVRVYVSVSGAARVQAHGLQFVRQDAVRRPTLCLAAVGRLLCVIWRNGKQFIIPLLVYPLKIYCLIESIKGVGTRTKLI